MCCYLWPIGDEAVQYRTKLSFYLCLKVWMYGLSSNCTPNSAQLWTNMSLTLNLPTPSFSPRYNNRTISCSFSSQSLKVTLSLSLPLFFLLHKLWNFNNNKCWLFLSLQCKREYTSVMIVPTGVGAAIGGFAGDSLPVARALSSVVDCLITHPNVTLSYPISSFYFTLLVANAVFFWS